MVDRDANNLESTAHRGEPSSSYSGESAGWNELAEKLSELSRTLQNENDLESTLHSIVVAAVGTVPGAEHASISAVSRHRQVQTLAATDDVARAVDQAQYDIGEGPCLDSLYNHKTVRLADLTADTPWPKFTERARREGLGGMLAIQMYVTGENLGALNLHSGRTNAFDDESEQVGLLFAAHAAVALAGAQDHEHLELALTSRDIIGQAKGILMERFKLSAQDAFNLLVIASQTTNLKLRDIADHLTQPANSARPSPRTGAKNPGQPYDPSRPPAGPGPRRPRPAADRATRAQSPILVTHGASAT